MSADKSNQLDEVKAPAGYIIIYDERGNQALIKDDRPGTPYLAALDPIVLEKIRQALR